MIEMSDAHPSVLLQRNLDLEVRLQEATNRALQAERTIANLASHMTACRPCR